jgi:hypothetical protein
VSRMECLQKKNISSSIACSKLIVRSHFQTQFHIQILFQLSTIPTNIQSTHRRCPPLKHVRHSSFEAKARTALDYPRMKLLQMCPNDYKLLSYTFFEITLISRLPSFLYDRTRCPPVCCWGGGFLTTIALLVLLSGRIDYPIRLFTGRLKLFKD